MKFIGQKKIVGELREAIKVSLAEKKQFPHTLFYGERGYGKTRLATWLSQKLRYNLLLTTGGNLTKETIPKTLVRLSKKSLIFVDEIHSISLKAAEELYTPMQDFVVPFKIDWDIMTVDVPKFTLVGATTEAGNLPKPLFDRFVYHFIMEPYTKEELVEILLLASSKDIDSAALELLSSICQGNPRIGINYLRRCENLSGDVTTVDSVRRLMEFIGISSGGFTSIQYKYLSLLHRANSPIGKNAIAISLALPESYIETNVEPLLMQKGLITRTSRGRKITKEGEQFLKKLLEDKWF